MTKRAMFSAAIAVAAAVLQAQIPDFREPEVLPTGKFSRASRTGTAAVSPDGKYECVYNAVPGAAERFRIRGFSFFQGTSLLYHKNELPGNSISVSNAGLCAAFDVGDDAPALTVYIFGRNGELLVSRTVTGATFSGFSAGGTRFGIGRDGRFDYIEPVAKTTRTYNIAAWQFDVSRDERLLALAGEKSVTVFDGEQRVAEIPHSLPYIRAIAFSPDNRRLGFIGKNELFVYSLPGGAPLFSDRVEEPFSLCDMRFGPGGLWAGIQCRDRSKNELRGILRRYDNSGAAVADEVTSVKRYPPPEVPGRSLKKNDGRASFPWPFKPQDKPCKAWNGYLALSASSDGNTGDAYLHQGLDLDVPANAPTCSVADGYVKARLSTGGELYWRVAVSETQTADSSEGWLYAHLVESSITVNVGDKVKTGDVLGEIIAWPGLAGGHIHFSRLRARGSTWSSWRNFCNPQLLLTPAGDTIAPEIKDAFSYSKFGFSTNDSSSSIKYLQPDNLSGTVDFIARIRDAAGESPWTQPATEIYYWVRSLRTNAIVFPRTIGLIRNQGMPDYAGSTYQSLTPVMYRVDASFPVKGWFTKERLCAHIITNNNGDSVITAQDKKCAFNTKTHPDGRYRLSVEAFDAAGNRVIDSQEIVFKNGNIVGTGTDAAATAAAVFGIKRISRDGRCFTVTFRLPAVTAARLSIVDIAGRTVRMLPVDACENGRSLVRWDGSSGNNRKAAPGVYVAVLRAGNEQWYAKVQRP